MFWIAVTFVVDNCRCLELPFGPGSVEEIDRFVGRLTVLANWRGVTIVCGMSAMPPDLETELLPIPTDLKGLLDDVKASHQLLVSI